MTILRGDNGKPAFCNGLFQDGSEDDCSNCGPCGICEPDSYTVSIGLLSSNCACVGGSAAAGSDPADFGGAFVCEVTKNPTFCNIYLGECLYTRPSGCGTPSSVIKVRLDVNIGTANVRWCDTGSLNPTCGTFSPSCCIGANWVCSRTTTSQASGCRAVNSYPNGGTGGCCGQFVDFPLNVVVS